MALSPIPLEIVETIGSTSDALKQRAEQGSEEIALLARTQTGGRGRLGRGWVSPPGNVYLSVLLRPGPLRWPGHWSLLAAVAVAETLEAVAPGAPIALKWPNDLLLSGGKLAGVLTEAGVGQTPWLVIGIGVNLEVAPEGIGRATAALGRGEAETVASRILDRLQAWRYRYGAEGFAPVRTAWLRRGPENGVALAVRCGSEMLIGKFAGIAESGALLLATPSGTVPVVAGEVC